MSMKKLILLSIIIFSCCAAYAETYLNAPLPDNAGALPPTINKMGDNYHIWDDKTQSYTNYTRQGNQIYGSDGSKYTQFGNTYQDNHTGQTYQINNNLIEPLY